MVWCLVKHRDNFNVIFIHRIVALAITQYLRLLAIKSYHIGITVQLNIYYILMEIPHI
jgi:hypothetical protein